MTDAEKLAALKRVIEQELILGHAPLDEADTCNMPFLLGRQSCKAWAMDVGHRLLGIIRDGKDVDTIR